MFTEHLYTLGMALSPFYASPLLGHKQPSEVGPARRPIFHTEGERSLQMNKVRLEEAK